MRRLSSVSLQTASSSCALVRELPGLGSAEPSFYSLMLPGTLWPEVVVSVRVAIIGRSQYWLRNRRHLLESRVGEFLRLSNPLAPQLREGNSIEILYPDSCLVWDTCFTRTIQVWRSKECDWIGKTLPTKMLSPFCFMAKFIEHLKKYKWKQDSYVQ